MYINIIVDRISPIIEHIRPIVAGAFIFPLLDFLYLSEKTRPRIPSVIPTIP